MRARQARPQIRFVHQNEKRQEKRFYLRKAKREDQITEEGQSQTQSKFQQFIHNLTLTQPTHHGEMTHSTCQHDRSPRETTLDN